ncbi:mitochondrial carrier [Artomyces pyxidatus]|uniref:Mitochondrial carrier n=1 Tax=Artomyces pyxidatus TaxID=48021 RepID=A0ACB8TH49_9AGAM|nr:mitochondrial carrier [Artomyces pyxidatus]
MDPFQAKLVAAASGSTMTALTMTPFDVVKTRLQTQPPRTQGALPPQPLPNVCCQPANVPCVRGTGAVRSMSTLALSRSLPQEIVCVWDNGVMRAERVTGFYDAVKHVWKVEGLRGLWKGAGTTLLMGVPASTTYMLTYDYLLRDAIPLVMPPALVPLTAGIAARSLVTSLVSPLELIRTNLQSTPQFVDKPHTLRSVLTSVRALAQTHGAQHLWRGLGPTLWRDVPFSGLYWAGYEGLKQRFAQAGREGAPIAFVCGATSGMGAALVTSPFDVLKTRRQALLMGGRNGRAEGTFAVLAHIVRTEGAGALFAGLGPRIAKIAPACGIMIACFEGVGRVLVKKDKQ